MGSIGERYRSCGAAQTGAASAELTCAPCQRQARRADPGRDTELSALSANRRSITQQAMSLQDASNGSDRQGKLD
jgi:hypothetical protein